MASFFSCLLLLAVALVDETFSMSVDSLPCPHAIEVPNGNGYEIPGPIYAIHYTCNIGFHIQGPSKLECVNGTWSPSDPPACVPDNPIELPGMVCATGPAVVVNGKVEYNDGDSNFPKKEGTMATVICDQGYSSEDKFQSSYMIMCGAHGLWTSLDGSVRLPACTRKHCPPPPEVPRAVYVYNPYSPQMSEGLQVQYYCSTGYVLLDSDNARLTCHNGQWDGPIPTCVLKVSCDSPEYVRNGMWKPVMREKTDNSPSFERQGDAEYPKFEVGSVIEYTCETGYKLVGHRVLQCIPSQIWSSDPPMCIPESDYTWYCPDIGQIKNGFCKCVSENTPDLQLCMPFHRGTQIECTCLQGYKLQGMEKLTCTHSSSLNIGVWDWDPPRCYKDFEDDIDVIPEGQQDKGQAYSTGDISDGKNKISSLVIVVTTACSVLGVLLLIMVFVVFRRKKPRAHLFQQGPAPPPYARVHNNSMDEHDRMALMAYADASRIHLPTYEEAVRTGSLGQGGNTPTGGPGIGRSSSPTSSEYRRLPSVHPAVRAANLQHQQNIGGDGNNNINNNNNNNSNRHSTVTTSTMNRDGVSEIFGSVDTVNVSMSDASTSVTVETFDSGTSNRSMASQRATAGSLTSSDDQLANDDAPLLDSNSQREVDVASVSSNPSRSSKEDQ